MRELALDGRRPPRRAWSDSGVGALWRGCAVAPSAASSRLRSASLRSKATPERERGREADDAQRRARERRLVHRGDEVEPDRTRRPLHACILSQQRELVRLCVAVALLQPLDPGARGRAAAHPGRRVHEHAARARRAARVSLAEGLQPLELDAPVRRQARHVDPVPRAVGSGARRESDPSSTLTNQVSSAGSRWRQALKATISCGCSETSASRAGASVSSSAPPERRRHRAGDVGTAGRGVGERHGPVRHGLAVGVAEHVAGMREAPRGVEPGRRPGDDAVARPVVRHHDPGGGAVPGRLGQHVGQAREHRAEVTERRRPETVSSVAATTRGREPAGAAHERELARREVDRDLVTPER